MYFLYSLGGVTFNKCWITLSILNCYSPNFQGSILIKNAINNQVGMLGDMFLWLVANLKQGVIYFIKLACSNDVLASVYLPSANIKKNHIFKLIFFSILTFSIIEEITSECTGLSNTKETKDNGHLDEFRCRNFVFGHSI